MCTEAGGMYIYLIRHGETGHNRDRRYQGQIDVPLSGEGKAGLMRAGFEPGIVYVSGLVRTLQTAELLFPDAEYRSVPGLNEMDFGVFDGRSAVELEKDIGIVLLDVTLTKLSASGEFIVLKVNNSRFHNAKLLYLPIFITKYEEILHPNCRRPDAGRLHRQGQGTL